MVRLVFCILLVSITAIASAQNRYIEQIENGKQHKTEIKIDKLLSKDSENIEALYVKSYLLQIDTHKSFNLKSSYALIIKAVDNYKRLQDNKIKSQLEKEGITIQSLEELVAEIGRKAIVLAKEENTTKAYQQFMDNFPRTPQYQVAETLRNESAYRDAQNKNTIESYNYFIKTYPTAKQVNSAWICIYEISFSEAVAQNNSLGYKAYLHNYPKSHLKDSAQALLFKSEYNENVKDDWESCLSFIDHHAENPYCQEAVQKVSTMIYRTQNPVRIHHIIERYRGTQDFYKLQLLHNAITIEGTEYCIKRFYNDNQTAIEKLGKVWNAIKERDDKIVSMAKTMYSTKKWEDYKAFAQYAAPTHKAFMAIQTTILDYIINKKWEKAASEVMSYFTLYGIGIHIKQEEKSILVTEVIEGSPAEQAGIVPGDIIIDVDGKGAKSIYVTSTKQLPVELEILHKDGTTQKKKLQRSFKINEGTWDEYPEKIENLISILLAPSDTSIKIAQLTELHCNNGREYCPIISADNRYLYFCGKSRTDSIFGEDVYVSERTKNGWGKPHVIEEISKNRWRNEAPLAISADGNVLALYLDGAIASVEKTETGWNDMPKYFETINLDGHWQSDITYSSDGNVMLFASMRHSNFDLYDYKEMGGKGQYTTDIYYSIKDEFGEWGTPVNLGPTINTIFSDRSPFLHPDMKTLYFASQGHGGLGDYDLFMSKRLADTCWTCWSEPVNLGKDINTGLCDWVYQISTDGKTAYYSRKSFEDESLYQITLPQSVRPEQVVAIKGQLKDKYGNPIKSQIRWEDLETGKQIGSSTTNPTDGSYFIILPLGKAYGYYVNNKDYFPISQSIDLREEKNRLLVEADITMVSFADMIEKSTAVPINNLFFDIDKWDLKPLSISELNRVSQIIKESGLKVEISGHTDNTGTKTHNLELSKKRAEAVKKYLVQLGCNENLLISIGYGDSMPVEENATEKGRSKNRRVEMRFVK